MTAPGPPLRVAWLGHTSAALGGGMATYSREVVARLRRRGHRVTFFQHDIPITKDEASQSKADEAVLLESLPLGGRLVLSSLKARRRLQDRLERRDFDVVHASFWFSSLDFDLPRACRRVGVPLVATFHVAFDQRPSVWGGLTSATYRLYAPTLAACDRVIVFGSSQRDVLVEMGVPPNTLRILPNGVDVDVYRPGPSDWKSRLGASLLFVYMGRVDSEKNVDVLLRAFLDCAPEKGVTRSFFHPASRASHSPCWRRWPAARRPWRPTSGWMGTPSGGPASSWTPGAWTTSYGSPSAS
jgi:glycosyltransferase involved in cell wall biosynthesis